MDGWKESSKEYNIDVIIWGIVLFAFISILQLFRRVFFFKGEKFLNLFIVV